MKDGGPAFPLQSIGPEFSAGYAGMALRDYFAAKAMQSLVINKATLSPEVPLSVRAYEIADAMLEARK